jgi:hypothetical protein
MIHPTQPKTQGPGHPIHPKTPGPGYPMIPSIHPKTRPLNPILRRLAKLFSNQQVQASKNHCLVLNLHLPVVTHTSPYFYTLKGLAPEKDLENTP